MRKRGFVPMPYIINARQTALQVAQALTPNKGDNTMAKRTAKKVQAKKVQAKKVAVKKAVAKKVAVKKAVAKKAVAEKVQAKKAVAEKAVATKRTGAVETPGKRNPVTHLQGDVKLSKGLGKVKTDKPLVPHTKRAQMLSEPKARSIRGINRNLVLCGAHQKDRTSYASGENGNRADLYGTLYCVKSQKHGILLCNTRGQKVPVNGAPAHIGDWTYGQWVEACFETAGSKFQLDDATSK